MKYFFVVLLFTSLTFAQNKEQRYQIVEVEKLHTDGEVGQIATSGTKKNLVLLDTQTGKTWYLTSYLVLADDKKTYIKMYQWTPIVYAMPTESISQLPPK